MPERAKNLKSGNIGGLVPAFSDEQVTQNQVRVLEGRNFDFTARGPRSGFGARALANVAVGTSFQFPRTFKQGNGHIMLLRDKVIKLEGCNSWVTCFEFEATHDCCDANCHPWSQAYVGETYYYSRPDVGIIYYDTHTGCWEQWDYEECGITGCIYGITEVANRLIIVGKDTTGWSAFDDGRNIKASEYTFAGFQSNNLAHFGTPLGVYSTSFGFFVFTTNGIMHGRVTDNENPFHFSTFATDNLPVGPNAITQLSDSTVGYVSKQGIHSLGRLANNQFQHQLLEPLMSDWLRTEYLPCIDICHDTIMLRYIEERKQLFLSFKALDGCYYDRALVFNSLYEKWSSFDQPHLSIDNFSFKNSNREYSSGYVTPENFVMEWDSNLDYIEDAISGARRPLDSFIIVGELKLEDGFSDGSNTMVTEGTIVTAGNYHKNYSPEDRELCCEARRDSWENFCATNSDFAATILGTKGNTDMLLWDMNAHERYYKFTYTDKELRVKVTACNVGEYYSIAAINLTGHITGL